MDGEGIGYRSRLHQVRVALSGMRGEACAENSASRGTGEMPACMAARVDEEAVGDKHVRGASAGRRDEDQHDKSASRLIRIARFRYHGRAYRVLVLDELDWACSQRPMAGMDPAWYSEAKRTGAL